MDSFSIAAIANCHHFSDLEQHRIISFKFWKSEILKSMCQQGYAPSGSCGGRSVSLPFPASGGHLPSLA